MEELFLAEINIGRLKATPDQPEVAEFVENFDRVNALAERSEGFIWRLVGDSGNAMEFYVDSDPRYIVNMSIWRDIERFQFFTFKTVHNSFVKRRESWFEKMERPHFAMWFVPRGEYPPIEEGFRRLQILEERGESREAFTWKSVKDGRYLDAELVDKG